MKDKEKHALLQQGFHATITRPLSLQDFIAQLDEALSKEELIILNNANLTRASLPEAQQEIQTQQNCLQKHAILCGSTSGLMHILPPKYDSEKLESLTVQQVREYYTFYAKMVMKRKKCTCDGLSTVGFELAKNMLQKNSIQHITIELCNLMNWSHTLLHLRQTLPNGQHKNVFYDPWFQRCYTNTPGQPKIFSDEELATEITKLISYTTAIQPTTQLSDLENNIIVANTDRDFRYVVACSMGDFSNPSLVVSDPSKIPFCHIC